MRVNYDKLWTKLLERNMTQSDLAKECNIDEYILTKMRYGKIVSLETLGKLCEYFGCDFDGLVSYKVNEFQRIESESDFNNLLNIIKESLIDFMIKNGYSESMVAKKTTLSINTIKKLLKGETISSLSIWKLNRLGKSYTDFIDLRLKKYKLDKKIDELKDI